MPILKWLTKQYVRNSSTLPRHLLADLSGADRESKGKELQKQLEKLNPSIVFVKMAGEGRVEREDEIRADVWKKEVGNAHTQLRIQNYAWGGHYVWLSEEKKKAMDSQAEINVAMILVGNLSEKYSVFAGPGEDGALYLLYVER